MRATAKVDCQIVTIGHESALRELVGFIKQWSEISCYLQLCHCDSAIAARSPKFSVHFLSSAESLGHSRRWHGHPSAEEATYPQKLSQTHIWQVSLLYLTNEEKSLYLELDQQRACDAVELTALTVNLYLTPGKILMDLDHWFISWFCMNLDHRTKENLCSIKFMFD